MTDSDVDDALAELGVGAEQRLRLATLARERRKAKLESLFGTRPASFLLVGGTREDSEPDLLRHMRKREQGGDEKEGKLRTPIDDFDAEADEEQRNRKKITVIIFLLKKKVQCSIQNIFKFNL